MSIVDQWIKSQYQDLLNRKSVEILIKDTGKYSKKFEELNEVKPVLKTINDGWYYVSLPE